jgi:hypothetical protein
MFRRKHKQEKQVYLNTNMLKFKVSKNIFRKNVYFYTKQKHFSSTQKHIQ